MVPHLNSLDHTFWVCAGVYSHVVALHDHVSRAGIGFFYLLKVWTIYHAGSRGIGYVDASLLQNVVNKVAAI
jgi:hypothetical protein